MRDPSQRDLVLFLPDEILIIDILSNAAWQVRYEFSVGGRSKWVESTAGVPRGGAEQPYVPKPEAQIPRRRDHALARHVRQQLVQPRHVCRRHAQREGVPRKHLRKRRRVAAHGRRRRVTAIGDWSQRMVIRKY